MIKKNELLSAQIGAAIRAYRAESCPACDGQKSRIENWFCDRCALRLPLSFRDVLDDRSRFMELFHPAMDHLRGNSDGL